MLNMNNEDDRKKMMNYYRTSDMLNLIYFFPKLSPVENLTIIENINDYYNNLNLVKKLPYNRVDTIKGRPPIIGIENAGLNTDDQFKKTLKKIKEKDAFGVLVLFNINSAPTKRYQRYAGITVSVDLGKDVTIEAVSQGFDGREVSKGICTHERYYIPWFDLRKVNIDNFKKYQTFQINNEDYKATRLERIKFLESIGVEKKDFIKYIPKDYQSIPNFIWLDIITNLLKQLEKNEDFLAAYNLTTFAISGHTEGKHFAPWAIFDKSRYTLVEKKQVTKE